VKGAPRQVLDGMTLRPVATDPSSSIVARNATLNVTGDPV
jgi:hypothetical protein